ncbi:CopY family transcriptional regulator [Micromonospora globispora]|uniref:CopY family transcriptional regulator n=1 Tax=Micromonospora globispora TaxID=1450148 RepID=A0A317K230_9ACTN|nr:BlaI/MecI/CopY family transcriptional regulator [Micromonospora globispora]PWU46354.1 CopY family transcriptional regulator [Micromonospora globispora]PWU58562.1 CopY family transcriptional regulator [Micromonospora globispora]RQW87763.1 CopY family transcriptional regulator [Micromonospora globispora]
MDHGRRPRGGLEQQVLAALAGAPGPLTPAQVRDRLDGDLAYTTVMTVLARLTAKGILTRVRAGRAYTYRLIGDEAELTARRMRRLLDAGGDRTAVLTRFVGTLSADDEQLLVELLTAAESSTEQG